MTEVTEGYFLLYRGSVWSVKGCHHPRGYAIAVPRVFQGKKIKGFEESLRVVRESFSDLLTYIEEIGFKVPLIPLEEAVVLDPFSKELPPELTWVREVFGRVGVTGSLLYGGWSMGSDIDLLSLEPRDFQRLLRLRREGVTRPLKEVKAEDIETLDARDMALLKEGRVLEGEVKGFQYTYKIVDCVKMGRVLERVPFQGEIVISRIIRGFTIPVVYEVDTSQGTLTATSTRTRFTELKEGMKFYVSGGTIMVREGGVEDLDLDLARSVRLSGSP